MQLKSLQTPSCLLVASAVKIDYYNLLLKAQKKLKGKNLRKTRKMIK